MKRYSELIALPTFKERFNYARLEGKIGEETFGFERYLNQVLYHSSEWYSIKRKIILRDNGCDLADPDYSIGGRVYIHHLNPITAEDIRNRARCVLDPENLICVSFNTHNAIHYGTDILNEQIIERYPNDTCPWKR